MTDFNKVLTSGDYENGIVNAVIEISEGSILKIEWNRHISAFQLDRIEPSIFPKPVNYGFIPQTLDEDGDELDILVVSPEPIPTGVYTEAKIIGILNFEDDNEMDYKIVAVPLDDRNNGNRITDINDLGEKWKLQIEYHFSHYKDLKKLNSTKVLGWGDINEAKKIIKECIERYKTN
ncbi:MAG: inorganic diphosphatase [Candidatus Saccharimonadales bacterium]